MYETVRSTWTDPLFQREFLSVFRKTLVSAVPNESGRGRVTRRGGDGEESGTSAPKEGLDRVALSSDGTECGSLVAKDYKGLHFSLGDKQRQSPSAVSHTSVQAQE